jgi:hypothetical protein
MYSDKSRKVVKFHKFKLKFKEQKVKLREVLPSLVLKPAARCQVPAPAPLAHPNHLAPPSRLLFSTRWTKNIGVGFLHFVQVPY